MNSRAARRASVEESPQPFTRRKQFPVCAGPADELDTERKARLAAKSRHRERRGAEQGPEPREARFAGRAESDGGLPDDPRSQEDVDVTEHDVEPGACLRSPAPDALILERIDRGSPGENVAERPRQLGCPTGWIAGQCKERQSQA